MTIKRLSETLTFNDDDKQIIATMKKVGVWSEMERIAKIGGGNRQSGHSNNENSRKPSHSEAFTVTTFND